MPPVVLPPVEMPAVKISEERSLDKALVMYDPRDHKIAALETSLQSLQETLAKIQSTSVSASLQQLPVPPITCSIPEYVSHVALNREINLPPVVPNHLIKQPANQFPISAYQEPDAMCSFLFRMQQHSFENYQFAQQRTYY